MPGPLGDGERSAVIRRPSRRRTPPARRRAAQPSPGPTRPIGEVRWREEARIRGKVRSMRVRPWADVATLECVVADETGGLLLVFLGRRQVAGLGLGRELIAAGTVSAQRGYLAILNPVVELLPDSHATD